MAPKKAVQWSDGVVMPKAVNGGRVTRSSSTRRSSTRRRVDDESDELTQAKKKVKSSTSTTTSSKGKGKGVKGAAGKIVAAALVEELMESGGGAAEGKTSKTVVIEHCKQCNSFKTRAAQVKNGLENGLPGITVLVNPEKPRRGCFEIREEGGEKFISLLDMKRPFKPMKELDMDEVIADIIGKIE